MLALFSLAVCEKDRQEFEPEPNILAVMKISGRQYESQEIFIDQTFNIKDTLSRDEEFSDISGLSGAEVVVSSADDTFYFEEDPWGLFSPGHYFTLYQSPVFNDSTLYTLEVCLPWGDTVTGEAYMPGRITIYWPGEGDTISLSQELCDSNLVCWRKSRNVNRYMVHLLYPEWGYVTDYYYFVGDTSCAFFAEQSSDIPTHWFVPLKLHVMGLTPEYEDYWDPRSYGESNLSCRYGVFTGIALAEVNVYIVE